MCESRKQGKAARPMLERETLELSWTGLKPITTRFLGQCSTNWKALGVLT